MKQILLTICARGGSKGIPGKNIRPLNGRPLIAYTIETAKAFAEAMPPGTVDMILSTDSDKIRETAAEWGLSGDYRRPERLATDGCGKVDAIKDVLMYQEKKTGKRYDYVLDLDVTSPLRTKEDLMAAFEIIEQDEGATNLYSVSLPGRNPYFNQVEKKSNGYYDLVKNDGLFLSRQTAPQVYDQNASFYYYKRSFFDQGYTSCDTGLSLVYLMPHICFDLDNPLDFEFMSFLLENHKLGFEL